MWLHISPLFRSRLSARRSVNGQQPHAASEEAPFQFGFLATKTGLTLAHGGTLFIVVIALTTSTIGHTEHLETLLYLVTFALLLPLAAVAAHLQLARMSTRPDLAALLAGGNLAALSATLLLGRLMLDIDGTSALWAEFLQGAALIALGNWAAMRLLGLVTQPVRLPAVAPALPAALVLGALSLFVPTHHHWLATEHLIALIGIAVVMALMLAKASAIKPGRSLTVALDVIVALILIPLLAEDFNAYGTSLRLDQDFYLGPANAILHGSPMLVDTFAQYGVGVMYFLAGIFEVIPIGYGSLQLVNGFLTALEFVLIYVVLRIGCRSQLYAILGTSVGLVANVFTGIGPHVGYGSVGPLRFGLPWLFITVAVLAARSPRRMFSIGMLAIVGVSAIWSFETFLYTTAAFIAALALRLALEEGSRRERAGHAYRQLYALASVVVGTHLAFAIATRVLGGEWPDWSGYLAYVRLYGWEGFGNELIRPWSLGYLIAGLYLVSTAGLVFVTLDQKAFASARRVELTAIAATTAFGIVSYTYFLGRSHPNNLHHISLSAIAVATLWIALVTRHAAVRHRIAGAATLGLVGLVAAAIVVEQPSVTRQALSASPMRHVAQLRPSLITRAHTVLDERPDDRHAVEAAQLLDEFAPGSSRVAVVAPADWQTEALIRAHRGNLLPTAIPNQDSLLPARSFALVEKRLSRLGPGSVVLTTRWYLNRPPRDKSQLVFRATDDYQLVVLSEIRRLFAYRVAATTPDGLVVLILK